MNELPLDRKRSSSVSFTRPIRDNDLENDDGDEIHISLAPYIQTYLANSGHGLGCCGIGLPIPFERAASGSWWNLKFDSDILEGQFRRSTFPQIRLRFRYALMYILIMSITWLCYFTINGLERKSEYWPIISATFALFTVVVFSVLLLTYTKKYKRLVVLMAVGVAILLCVLSLALLVSVPPDTDGLTLVGHFALCSEILLLIYTVLPMPLYACMIISVLYSGLFEFITAYFYGLKSFAQIANSDNSIIELPSVQTRARDLFNNVTSSIFKRSLSVSDLISSFNGTKIPGVLPSFLLNASLNANHPSSPVALGRNVDWASALTVRILMQICIHLIGIHILIMTLVRMRGTFMKVGQSLLVRRQLEMEKQLKEKMIHSVMPPKVSDWLLEESEREREREDSLKKGSIPSNNTDIRSLFRPFNMLSMDDVSILFADIVGFTKMSSNKTAEELVGILNDLFERFDELCEQNGCEKISTLGDCYYCVSGCPEPRSDHAKCCIEMGLAMIEAIKQFDIERQEEVNMRVGVHTGTVLCGIVGMKRFKFDVWSNDVTFANKLESTGKPGRVHLSEKTLQFLNDQYLVEQGDTINGVKTYFIKTRKTDFMSQFITQVTSSPTSISPILHSRPRLGSYNSQSKPKYHYLQMLTSPSNYRLKANSLPSILDSDIEEGDEDTGDKKDVNKSPTSTASCGKKKLRRPWRYLQRQKTAEEMTPLETENKPMVISSDPDPGKDQTNGFNRTSSISNSVGVAVEMDPMPSSPLLPRQDTLSHASSICSRKDSGIRSNSRRSSIQQQLFLMNGLAQGDLLGPRVSGYYTSTSTLNSTQDHSSSAPPYQFPPTVTDSFGACFHKLRKQSDLQLIRCVQDNVTSQRSYFVKPPLSSLTLFFKNKDMEKEYRENAHKVSEIFGGSPPTLATSRFNTYFDILMSALVFTAVSVALFLICVPSTYYLVFFAFATLIQVFAVSLCVRQLLDPTLVKSTLAGKIFKFLSHWYPWHACGALLVGLPMVSILLNSGCGGFRHLDYYYCYLVFVGLMHFCNFTQLNCWMKNFLVVLAGLIFICLVMGQIGIYQSPSSIVSLQLNHSLFRIPLIDKQLRGINTLSLDDDNNFVKYLDRLYHVEILLDLALLLLLVCFLNREFEISYRLSFHGNAVAARDKTRVQSMKNQADWLLHNIIPKYVADQLKTTAKYSQNHKMVGIMFASIVNFNELYDESYLGGKEYLRVLNELIGDFDELLEKSEYANVEKIKTIGSTFMAASGLNPQVRQQSKHEYSHLYQLLDFASAMQKVIYDFNQDLLGFKLILRVGFNFGDVTAGVIGATKLYYDIWGDAVNIASRMDSTGVHGEIQFPSNCLDVIALKYNFEPRGQVYVKGKDNMNVFLLRGKKQ